MFRMPELPEVETVLRAVRPVLVGNRIVNVDILRPNMVHDPASLERDVTGGAIRDVTRHGKYLFVHFDHGMTMILHLKMSGRLGLRSLDDASLTYERIRFGPEDGRLLVFNDPRTLGRVAVHSTENIPRLASIRLLGPDALDVHCETFVQRLTMHEGALKRVLLDQSFVAGIGNIYADEACFLAKLDPRRRVNALTPVEQRRLHQCVVETLKRGVDNMGTSFSDFADLFGKPGQNQDSLSVYGRKGEPCRDCSSKLASAVIGQRTTVWCPGCQR